MTGKLHCHSGTSKWTRCANECKVHVGVCSLSIWNGSVRDRFNRSHTERLSTRKPSQPIISTEHKGRCANWGRMLPIVAEHKESKKNKQIMWRNRQLRGKASTKRPPVQRIFNQWMVNAANQCSRLRSRLRTPNACNFHCVSATEQQVIHARRKKTRKMRFV